METIKLIDGIFKPEEAKELLLLIIEKKIDFHNLQNLSSQIRYNCPNAVSEVRIKELHAAKAQLMALFRQATAEQTDLVIKATLNIGLQAREQDKELCSAAESY